MHNPSANPHAAMSGFGGLLGAGAPYSHTRRQLSLREMAKREADAASGKPTSIRALFDYWKERRSVTAFDPNGAFTPEQFRWIAWVDVSRPDPMSYVFRHHPGYLLGDWSGRSLKEYPNQIHARSLALEYLACKVVRQPSYYEITQTVGPVRRTYMRLLLPASGRGRFVSRLYYAIRYVSIETGLPGESITAAGVGRPPS
jgi:hypothetical protein